MEYILICFCIVIDIYETIDFFKPFFNKKYLKEEYKLKLVSPIWQYIIICVAFLGAICFLFSFITQGEVSNIVFFSLLFFTGKVELSRSYVLVCRDGLFLNGTYFSNQEKQEAQAVTRIIFWHRRIYAIRTASKYDYVFLSRKYIDELTK
ncbi:MAG: hypothetical protein ACYDEX_06870 [Mobilitalea sp.]